MQSDPAKSQLAEGSLEYRLKRLLLQPFVNLSNVADLNGAYLSDNDVANSNTIFVKTGNPTTPLGLCLRLEDQDQDGNRYIAPINFFEPDFQPAFREVRPATPLGTQNTVTVYLQWKYKQFFSYMALNDAQKLAFARFSAMPEYFIDIQGIAAITAAGASFPRITTRPEYLYVIDWL